MFGFSFLEENADKVQPSIIDGVEPSFEAIGSGDYPVSRSLFFYVKEDHKDTIPGLKEYVAAFTSEKAIGEEGYLTDRGLIPLPASDWKLVRAAGTSLKCQTFKKQKFLSITGAAIANSSPFVSSEVI